MWHLGGNEDKKKTILGIVKWYHPCFGSMKRKFDSSYRDQTTRLWRNQVDASDLKSDVRKGVPVRFRSVVPAGIRIMDNTGDLV